MPFILARQAANPQPSELTCFHNMRLACEDHDCPISSPVVTIQLCGSSIAPSCQMLEQRAIPARFG
jgi:hypothetical protein